MSTRSLICVVDKSGEYKIAQFCLFGGHIFGVGEGIRKFLSRKNNVIKLRTALHKTYFLDKEDRDKEFIANFEKKLRFGGLSHEEQLWYDLFISSDVGENILYNIANSDVDKIPLINSLSFAGNSLFCEWCYVIDFNTNTFEIYKGFNENPVEEGRFLSCDPSLDKSTSFPHEPVVLFAKFNLGFIPTRKEFLKLGGRLK